jgi:hypothetical protein
MKLTLKSVVEIHEQPSGGFVGAPPGNIDMDMSKMVSDPIRFIDLSCSQIAESLIDR